MHNFPRLFKKDKKGCIRYWDIKVQESHIILEYGVVNTSSPNISTDKITKGKNLGKVNSTSLEEQAFKEAEYRWKYQINRNGYFESLSQAISEEANKVSPTLAKVYDPDKPPGYKVAIQPKLDGIRCIALKRDSEVLLMSRTGKLITTLPHINNYLSNLDFSSLEFLDGELYAHKYRKDFSTLCSIVKRDSVVDSHTDIEFHVFDCKSSKDLTFKERYNLLNSLNLGNLPYIKVVETLFNIELLDIPSKYSYFTSQEYEGIMIRNIDSPYENFRTSNLLKYKEMRDSEFKIVDISSGRGKLKNCGIIQCITPSNDIFKVKMSGSYKDLEVLLTDKEKYIGKYLTVQYQSLDPVTGIPRFPVGVRIREDL